MRRKPTSRTHHHNKERDRRRRRMKTQKKGSLDSTSSAQTANERFPWMILAERVESRVRGGGGGE